MIDKLFNPDKIAVIGASRHEGKTGHEIYDNLIHDFEGETVPVNPNAKKIHGNKCYSETPTDTDLAVIVVPGKIVSDVLEDCAEKNVSAAIVISAGFSETGNEELEQEILEIANENDIALLGPNVLGLINTDNSMNASFASKMPENGKISFMSQSGAFCTAILDYAKAEHIGFKHFVSIGNKAQINEVDLLKYWRETDTETIIGYTEGIENGKEFMRQARKTSKEKPIVMVKSGRTQKGGEAASSHTGSIAGSYQAYNAAFKQTGIIEAESNRELLNYGRTLAYQPLPQGKNVGIVTNAGGPGVITTDEVAEHGLDLAEFRHTTKRKLEQALPEEAALHNPVDVIGDAGHERYKEAVEAVAQDENVDSVIVVLTPQANTEIKKTAKTIAQINKKLDKTITACFIGEQDVQKGVKILENNKIPEFKDPVDAVKTIKQLNKYREYRETEKDYPSIERNVEKAKSAIEDLTKYKNQEELFESYNISTPLTEVVNSPQEAVEAASRIGYPVVMKIDAENISHKTDIGGVKTQVETRKEVEKTFEELIDKAYQAQQEPKLNGVQIQEQVEGTEVAIGMKRDPQFGPMIMVGLGGIYIEALKDISFRIAPVSEQEAEKMIHELQSHEIFEGTRNQEKILEPVKDTILKLSQLSLDNPSIQEIDINPLMVERENARIADIVIKTKSEE